MGLVKKEEAPLKSSDEAPDEPEDPPVVKTLKEIDDRYLAIEREYEKEVMALQLEYARKQQPFLEERRDLLASGGPAPGTGTPALTGFWLQALKNHPAFQAKFEEWDEPVLEYLTDIGKDYLDESNTEKGFRLTFHFAENPYFTNATLEKEYATEEANPYNGEIECKAIKSSQIDWKAGKNITVARAPKAAKAGRGGRKQAAKKALEEEPRPSFFREFFRDLAPGCVQEEFKIADDSDDDEDMMTQYLMNGDFETGTALRDHIIPFAVRWYTGEAVPEGFEGGPEDDDSEDDDDDDDDLEDDDDDDDEDSDEPPRGKGKGRGKGKSKSGATRAGGGAPGGKGKEECKQQ